MKLVGLCILFAMGLSLSLFAIDVEACVKDYASANVSPSAVHRDVAATAAADHPTMALAKRLVYEQNLKRGKNLGDYAMKLPGGKEFPAIPEKYRRSSLVDLFPFFGRQPTAETREIAAMMDWCIEKGQIHFDIAGVDLKASHDILDKTTQLMRKRALAELTTDPVKKSEHEWDAIEIDNDLLDLALKRYTEWELARLAFIHPKLDSPRVKFFNNGVEVTPAERTKILEAMKLKK